MPPMRSEVYDALREAGASEEKARNAAEAVAGCETRLAAIEQTMTALAGKVTVLTRLIAFTLALTVALLWTAVMA